MPLTLADFGEKMMIQNVGGKPEVKQQLRHLGFVPGGSVTVLTTLGGNLIVEIKKTRIALNREMAQKIMVSFYNPLSTQQEAFV